MAAGTIPRVTPKRGVILDLLRDKGWTQKVLAERLNIDPAHLARQLVGSRPMDLVTAVLIASKLDVDWSDIVAESCPTCGVNIGPRKAAA